MEMHWKIRRIGILSVMKVGCVVSCVLGFIIGTLLGMAIVFFSSVLAVMFDSPLPGIGASLSLVVMPIAGMVLYGILGTFFSFLLSLLYNLAAGLMGGIEVDVDTERKEKITDFNYEI